MTDDVTLPEEARAPLEAQHAADLALYAALIETHRQEQAQVATLREALRKSGEDIKAWHDWLADIQKTLERLVADPTDGHLPIWAAEDLRKIGYIRNGIYIRPGRIDAVLATPSTEILARIKAEAVAKFLTAERIAAALRQVAPRGLCPSCGVWFGPDQDPPHLPEVLADFAAALRAALLTENQP